MTLGDVFYTLGRSALCTDSEDLFHRMLGMLILYDSCGNLLMIDRSTFFMYNAVLFLVSVSM